MADEVIREVRRIRHEISQQCGHDVHKVVAYYRAFQDELKQSGKYHFANTDQDPGTQAPPVEVVEQTNARNEERLSAGHG